MLLGTRDLSKIKRVGIKLDDIDKALRKEGHQLLVTEIFQAIISIIEEKNEIFLIKVLIKGLCILKDLLSLPP